MHSIKSYALAGLGWACILMTACRASNRDIMSKNIEIEPLESLPLSDDIFRYIPPERKNINQHIEKVDFFDSEISIGYKNKDGTYTVYIFSSPLRYKEGADGLTDIDNRLVKINSGKYAENGYLYRNNKNDILSYFPQGISDKQGFLIESYFYDYTFGLCSFNGSASAKENTYNIYGQENDIVKYMAKDTDTLLRTYATKAGIRTEVVLFQPPPNNKVSFWLSSSSLTPLVGEGGYILLNDYNEKEENRLQGIIRPPLVKDSYDGESNESNEHLFWNNKLILTKDNNEFYRIDLVLDSRLSENSDIQYPITIDMSWEMHRGKLPDSVIYSEMPQQNQYLTDISVIGKSVPYGLGRQYSRLRLHEYIIDDPQNIKSAYYGCYDLTGFSTPCIIAVCQMEDFWSSTGLTWDNRVKEGGEISQKIIKGGGYMLFDITKIARASMNDTSYNMDSFGILLKERSEENFYRIFASSDHCLFPVFQEVTFYQLPKQFNAYLKN